MTPQKAAEITGVPVEKIIEASYLYAQAKPASISWGLAIDQKANGMQAGQCLLDLMAITGNIDVPGGNILGDATTGLNEVGFGFDKGVGDLASKMIGLADYPAYCNLIMNAHADLMLKALETGDPYPVKFGMYAGNNLMSCTSAEPKRWHDAIVKSLEFCFTIDTFITPSAQASCDVILPLAASAERDGTNYDRLTKQYGRETCVVFVGTGREGGTFNPYGSVMLGTPNYCYTQSGYACYIPRLAAASYIVGAAYPEIDYACSLPGRFDDPDYTLPECVVMWGKMPLASNGDGLFGHAVVDMMRRGTRLITVDPRMNWLSSRADVHLRLRPGTDTALAMGMLSVIINDDLYDHDFVECWCYGFDELKARTLRRA